eukprot:1190735-Alexandrium_andersonii.AAC.1
MAQPTAQVEVHEAGTIELHPLLAGRLSRLGRQQRTLARGRSLGLQVHDCSALAKAAGNVPRES